MVEQAQQQQQETYFAITGNELQTLLNNLMGLKGEVSPGDVILSYEILKGVGQRKIDVEGSEVQNFEGTVDVPESVWQEEEASESH